MNFLRDVVIPLATLTTTVACVFITYKLFELGSIGGGLCTLGLVAAFGYFVYYDAKRLLAKIS